MIVSNKNQISEIQLQGEGIKDAFKKVLISPNEGWEGNVMRVFKIKSGGNTPKHEHPWFHVNYILKGKGILYLDGTNYEIKEGSFAYVPAGK
ncbi:MAG: cupin domain-containing protein, partial [Clostridiaceae bacterium]|nr:cupin domain-containing protein [Clostridiaceae bacterium]